MHSSSYLNMKNFIDKYLNFSERLRIIDIGSQDVGQNSSYKELFNQENWTYVGCDMVSGMNVDVVLSNVYSWKELKSNSADVIISGQVFEHIEYFWITMLEISRVLKTGGICCIIAPSGGNRHRYPLDCWRFYEDGFRALAKYACLDVVEAFTQRTRYDFEQFDPIWKDSVLICKKPKYSLLGKIKFLLRNTIDKAMISEFVLGGGVWMPIRLANL